MNLYKLPHTIAQAAYGEGNYGSGLYGAGETTTSGGSLSDTGMPVILIGTIGVALIVCAVVLLTKYRKSKK